MFNSTKTLPAIASFVLSLHLSAAEEPNKEKAFVITAIPSRNAKDAENKYQPLVDYLSKKLQVTVKYHHTSTYAQSVRSFTQGKAHLSWLGAVTGIQARESIKGSKAIAQGIGDWLNRSYFIAHKDLGIKKADTFPKDLEGKTFTFASRTSNAGRIMPEHFILQKTGKTPKEFFGEVHFTGARGHKGVAQDVKNKLVQAGVLSYHSYESMVKKGEIDANAVKVVWETPVYCGYHFSIHPDSETLFGKGFMEKVQKALIECKDPAALACINRPNGLIKASNANFAAVRKTMNTLNFQKK